MLVFSLLFPFALALALVVVARVVPFAVALVAAGFWRPAVVPEGLVPSSTLPFRAAGDQAPALTRDPLRDPASLDPLRSGAPDPLRDPRIADPLMSGAGWLGAHSVPGSSAG